MTDLEIKNEYKALLLQAYDSSYIISVYSDFCWMMERKKNEAKEQTLRYKKHGMLPYIFYWLSDTRPTRDLSELKIDIGIHFQSTLIGFYYNSLSINKNISDLKNRIDISKGFIWWSVTASAQQVLYRNKALTDLVMQDIVSGSFLMLTEKEIESLLSEISKKCADVRESLNDLTELCSKFN